VSRPDQEGWDLDPDRVIVRDKRRLDPESGQVREGADVPPAPAPDPEAEAAALNAEEDQLAAELTADLQRLSAEYANYRKRVERDRVAVSEMATAGLLSGLLPVLDDIDRAREHGDLTGAFASVAEALWAYVGKLGLEQFGEPGEPFDPAVHEALMQAEPDPAASVATCAQVLQKGYRLSGGTAAGRVLRPARVSVAEPGATSAES
jgi:molecular chaperone GrpE